MSRVQAYPARWVCAETCMGSRLRGNDACWTVAYEHRGTRLLQQLLHHAAGLAEVHLAGIALLQHRHDLAHLLG